MMFAHALALGAGGRAPFEPLATLASDFRTNMHRKDSLTYTNLLSVPGVTYSRSGADRRVGASLLLNSAGVPAIVAGEGIYIYRAFTNPLLRSEELDNATWSKSNASVTPNVTRTSGAPDKLVEDTANAIHWATQNVTVSGSATYAWWVDLEAGERSRARVAFRDTVVGDVAVAIFDLAAGSVAVTSAGAARIESLGGGVYRCIVTGTTGAGATIGSLFVQTARNDNSFSYLGDGVSGLYVHRGQLVAGSIPGPYVPTTSAAATANADVLTQAVDPLPAEFTVLWRGMVSAINAGASLRILEFHNGTDNEKVILDINASGQPQASVVNGGVSTFGPSIVTITTSTEFTVALRRTAGAYEWFVNGAKQTPSWSVAVPTVNALSHGSTRAGTNHLNGRAARFALRPYAMTDAEIAAW